jgi:signal transduction histidine kinase
VGITGWVAQTGESVRTGDVRQDPRYYAVRDNIRSELCVPLRLGDRVIGVINVESTRPYAYTEADQRVLETVAGQIAIAIQNAQLFKQLSNANARLQTLSHQLVNAQETERRAVARELHDEIGQALTAVHMNLQGLERVPAAVLVPHLQDSVSIVDHIIQQVRELALTLHPSLLDDLGLVPALRWYVDRQAQHTGFIVQLVAESLPTRLPQDLEIACFRIAQEALTNVLRHAQAHQAQIELSQRDAALHLVIRDDGVGFNVHAAQQRAVRGESMGLLSMQERVLLAGGELEVISAPRRGTEIRVRFPL